MKKYNIIYADPPWDHSDGTGFSYGNKDPRGRSGTHGISTHSIPYKHMSVDEIIGLPVKRLVDKNCVLYLWTTNRFIEQAYIVARGWGFKPSSLLVWCKPPNQGLFGGLYLSNIEFCIYATKGTVNANTKFGSRWFNWPRRKHSEKPHEFRQMIESAHNGYKVELFARQKTEGWDVWGNEVESNTSLTQALTGCRE